MTHRLTALQTAKKRSEPFAQMEKGHKPHDESRLVVHEPHRGVVPAAREEQSDAGGHRHRKEQRQQQGQPAFAVDTLRQGAVPAPMHPDMKQARKGEGRPRDEVEKSPELTVGMTGRMARAMEGQPRNKGQQEERHQSRIGIKHPFAFIHKSLQFPVCSGKDSGKTQADGGTIRGKTWTIRGICRERPKG